MLINATRLPQILNRLPVIVVLICEFWKCQSIQSVNLESSWGSSGETSADLVNYLSDWGGWGQGWGGRLGASEDRCFVGDEVIFQNDDEKRRSCVCVSGHDGVFWIGAATVDFGFSM